MGELTDIPILSDIYDAIKDIGSEVANLPSDIWNALKSGFDAFITAITSIVQAIYGFLKAIAEALVSIIHTLWDGLVSIAERVKEVLEKAWDVIKDVLGKLWGLIVGVVDWFSDKLLGVVHWIWNTIHEAISGLANWVAGLLRSFLYDVGGLLSNAVNKGVDAIPDMITADLGILGIWKGFNTIKEAKKWDDVKRGLFEMVGLPIVGWIAGELMRGLIPSFVGNKRLTLYSVVSGLTPVGTIDSATSTIPTYGYEVGSRLVPTTTYINASVGVYTSINALSELISPARIDANVVVDTNVWWGGSGESGVTAMIDVPISVEVLFNAGSIMETINTIATVGVEFQEEAPISTIINIPTSILVEFGGNVSMTMSVDVNNSVEGGIGWANAVLNASVLSDAFVNASLRTIENISVELNVEPTLGVEFRTTAPIVTTVSTTVGVEATFGASYNEVQFNKSLSTTTSVSASLMLSSSSGGGSGGSYSYSSQLPTPTTTLIKPNPTEKYLTPAVEPSLSVNTTL